MHSVDSQRDNYAKLEQLRAEHMALEKRLSKLTQAVHLTPSEQLEVRRIKQEKLVRKDQIQSLTCQQVSS